MISRSHQQGDMASTAVYSNCETYRYSLKRTWDAKLPSLAFIMLNPSTADERRNDPTIERCERRARAWGYGTMSIGNIFAFRATDPRDLKSASEPEGPNNNDTLLDMVKLADRVLLAWGAHGEHRGQGQKVIDLLRMIETPLYHLGLTKAGHPRHPLYVSYATQPIEWTNQ